MKKIAIYLSFDEEMDYDVLHCLDIYFWVTGDKNCFAVGNFYTTESLSD